jgi:hypothetical protein
MDARRWPIRVFLTLLAATGCAGSSDSATNDVPDPDGLVQFSTTPVPPLKLDLLFVLDDTASMAQHQGSLGAAFQRFDQALAKHGKPNLQVAFTTTNVCALGMPGAVRGKFVYDPAQEVDPNRVEKRVIPCSSDADCATWSTAHPEAPLPDPAHWVCEARPSGVQWTCDTPPQIKEQNGPDAFEPGDTLFTFTSQCRYLCNKDTTPDGCVSVFGQPAYRCLYPGGDATIAGCVLPPATDGCPAAADGPKVLNDAVADRWLKEWIAGRWAGSPDFDPQWKHLPTGDSAPDVAARDAARTGVFQRLFTCMATLAAPPGFACASQEQPLRAAWMALDKTGENAEQAANFLRDDTLLWIIAISDEDDCSAPEFQKADGTFANVVPFEDFGRCACLRDEQGCTAAGACDPAACLTDGVFDGAKCPLYSTTRSVNLLRSLKPDPAQVAFLAVTGGIVPGSTTSPSQDVGAIQQRYLDCKCSASNPAVAPFTYGCTGAHGRADLGIRMAQVAGAFGAGNGWVANLCADDTDFMLEDLVPQGELTLTPICLPQPLATPLFIEVRRYDPWGNCTTPDADGTCLPLVLATGPDAEGDYVLVQNSPACPLFDPTAGQRLENAILLKTPLTDSSRIDVRYQAQAE